jgi:peptidoglycan/xylan/chitin deacetylase (PgdA/CDA1 family)/N-acetylmuramoyl-L-alanine amidase
MKASPLLAIAILTSLLIPTSEATPLLRQEVNCDTPWLVLELPAQDDFASALQTFAFLRARDLRTLVVARPNADADTLRLAFADGHQLALALDLPADESDLEAEIAAQTAAWDALMTDLVGHPGLRLAHAPADAPLNRVRQALDPLGYRLLVDVPTPCNSPPVLATITIEPDAIARIYAQLQSGVAPHPAVGWQYVDSMAEVQSPTAEAFRAAHIVVVDPGHTRMDRGASIRTAQGEYVTEAWANLVRGRALRRALQDQGWDAILTHNDGRLFENPYNGTDMDGDLIVNNLDSLIFRAQLVYYVGLRTGRRPIIIMLHADSSGDANAAGFSVFYPDPYATTDQDASFRLAQVMHDQLEQIWQQMGVSVAGRGIHAGRSYGRERGPGAVFDIIDWRYRELPAARREGPVSPFVGVLVEAGMASNPAEAAHLATGKGNVWLGRSHAAALDQWMRAEIALLRFSQDGDHDDPPGELTPGQIAALTYGEINHGRTDDPPRMAFTFDAGTNAIYWPQLREILRERGITTTFFLTGDFIRANPAVVRQMLADGHDLQNHSDTHPDFTQMSAPAVRAELQAAQEALDRAIGAHLPMRLWRPPFGARNEEVWRAAAQTGMLCVWWSRTGDTTGWQSGVTAENVYNYVTWNFQPGQIYVAHLNSAADVQAMPDILDDALAQDYLIGDLWSVLSEEQVAALTSD